MQSWKACLILSLRLLLFHGKMKNESERRWNWGFLWSSYLISQNNSSTLKKKKVVASLCGWIWFQRMFYCNFALLWDSKHQCFMKYSNYLTKCIRLEIESIWLDLHNICRLFYFYFLFPLKVENLRNLSKALQKNS